MIPPIVGRLFGRWAYPIGGTPGPVVFPLRVLAVLLRLYAGFWFVLYGFDKLFGGDKQYGLDADSFANFGIPFPELNHGFVGGLEFVGGLALVLGLLTRLFGFLLAGNMLVAMLTAGDIAAEFPLFACSLLLVVLGGGIASIDQILDDALSRRRSLPTGEGPPVV